MKHRIKQNFKNQMAAIIVLAGMLIISFVLQGCKTAPVKSSTPPVVNDSVASTYLPPVEKRNPGSLWSANRRLQLYSDLRARNVGDIVTVNIVENSSANKQAKTQSDTDRSLAIKLDALLGGKYDGSSFRSGSDATISPQSIVNTRFQNSFNGNGKTNRTDTMSASIACRVVRVMPSGNLFIKGSRLIQVNYEKQFISLEGVVRTTDISPNNVVLSTNLADARITYNGNGPVSDKQRPGWLTRVFDFVWPF